MEEVGEVKFKNPLAALDDDFYISDNEEEVQDGKDIDPNE
jgi:hypothetical protein